MTNSDPSLRERAKTVIAEVTALLNESYLARHIDEPIDRAAARFVWDDSLPFSHRQFHEVISRFVSHVYAHGLPCPRHLSLTQANDEAVAMLECAYEGTCTNGYDAAVMDSVRAQPNGLDIVLTRLTEAIKMMQRSMHVRWVFARRLDPSAWELRCEIATFLLDRYRPWLPQEMHGCAGVQFADEIPTLLRYGLDTDSQLRQVSHGAVSLFA